MEAVVIRSTPKKKNARSFSYSRRSSENLAPVNMYDGLFPIPPPSLSYSYPPSALLLNNILSHPYHQQQNPPLLPLPIPISRSPSSLSSRCGSTSKKTSYRSKDQSVTPIPKKPKSKSPNPKFEESKKDANPRSESLVVASTNRLGPEPKDLPMDVPKVIVSSSSLSSLETGGCVVMGDLEKFSGGSVFSLSPHPSSLPLPRFSLRPNSKLSCNAEAAGIDAGATDNLRRLLRLR